VQQMLSPSPFCLPYLDENEAIICGIALAPSRSNERKLGFGGGGLAVSPMIFCKKVTQHTAYIYSDIDSRPSLFAPTGGI
jgi:hypothetical protein